MVGAWRYARAWFGGVALHAAAGRRARQAKVARLYALGELSAVAAREFGEGGHVFADL